MNEIEIIKKYHLYNRVANSDGFASSLSALSNDFDIEIQEYPVDDRICHWQIPKRWHVRNAKLYDPFGNIVVDYQDHPLHLWSFSHAFSGTISYESLVTDHLMTNPDMPHVIPFRFRQMFRHWESEWGFSLSDKTLKGLPPGNYRVEIDTIFTDEPMLTFTYTSHGKVEDTILLVGHWCHPGIAEDGLSGCSVGLKVVDELRKIDHHYTYKFIGIPEVIGAVAFLDKNHDIRKRFKACIALNFLGRNDYLALFYSINKRSKIDQALEHVLKYNTDFFETRNFKQKDLKALEPGNLGKMLYGVGSGDEAPFEAPGYNIPTTSLIRRTLYEEYHTHLDNPAILNQENLAEATRILLKAINVLENDWIPKRTFVGLPCLSSPDIDLWFNAPSESNIKTDHKIKTHLSVTMEKRNISLHDISTHLVYLLEGNYSVLELSDCFNVPFEFMLQYLKKWEEKKLINRSIDRDILLKEKKWYSPIFDPFS